MSNIGMQSKIAKTHSVFLVSSEHLSWLSFAFVNCGNCCFPTVENGCHNGGPILFEIAFEFLDICLKS